MRTAPAWRPPADIRPSRSKGWSSKASRQRRAARATQPEPSRQPARPASSATRARTYTNEEAERWPYANEETGRRSYTNEETGRRRSRMAPGSKASVAALNRELKDFGDTMKRLAEVDGIVPKVSRPIADVPQRRPPSAASQPQVNQAPRPNAMPVSMTGPLHADFVAEHNKVQQERRAPRRASGAIAEHAGVKLVTHYCDGVPLSPDNAPLDRF